MNYSVRKPLGVVGIISPWNLPMLLMTWKVGPALAAGNTLVVKPSEYTSASTLALMKLFEEAGFYGIEIVERQSEPWRTVDGIEFRSVTVVARTRMRTSLMPSSGSGTSRSSNPGPGPAFTRARMARLRY